MNKAAIYHLRFLAYLLLLAGTAILIRNLWLSYQSFNPTYLSHYIRQELSTPIILLLSGMTTRVFAKAIAARLTKGLENDSH